jgi:hypothetical protein
MIILFDKNQIELPYSIYPLLLYSLVLKSIKRDINSKEER